MFLNFPCEMNVQKCRLCRHILLNEITIYLKGKSIGPQSATYQPGETVKQKMQDMSRPDLIQFIQHPGWGWMGLRYGEVWGYSDTLPILSQINIFSRWMSVCVQVKFCIS